MPTVFICLIFFIFIFKLWPLFIIAFLSGFVIWGTWLALNNFIFIGACVFSTCLKFQYLLNIYSKCLYSFICWFTFSSKLSFKCKPIKAFVVSINKPLWGRCLKSLFQNSYNNFVKIWQAHWYRLSTQQSPNKWQKMTNFLVKNEIKWRKCPKKCQKKHYESQVENKLVSKRSKYRTLTDFITNNLYVL